MESKVAGIPCQIDVLHVFVQKPTPRADSSDDFHGYAEVEFDVCDRRGRPAPWLARKMTDRDRQRIETEILERA